MLGILEQLIHDHGAVFNHRNHRWSSAGITLTINGQGEAFFDRKLQKCFSGVIVPNNGILSGGMDLTSLIYRIQCFLCRSRTHEFNYVGQTIDSMETRESVHLNVINGNEGHNLARHLQQHRINEIGGENLMPEDIYEMQLLHDLSDNSAFPKHSTGEPCNENCNKYYCEKAKNDVRIRRAWEMFYQWLCKAMKFDGGGCKK